MERTSTTLIKLAQVGLAAVFVWNVVRAVTQSVTPGEAWNYDLYIAPVWREALSRFDTYNHLLNTILVRIATARIHLTELSMRLPSLLFGALYLWAVYRVARRWFGEGKMFLAVVGLLVLNPLIMDAMSEARGYGMALACWMWAVDAIGKTADRLPNRVGVLLGLSVAASLAFAAPAVALILVAATARRKLGYVPHLAFLTVFMLLAIPLNHAEKEVITQGPTSLRQTLNALTAGSLGTGNSVIATVVRVGIGLLAAAGLLVLTRRRADLLCLTGGSLVVTLALILAAHRWAHAAFPETGAIYLIPMVTLFVAALVVGWGRESVEVTFLVMAVLCVAHYADRLTLPYRAAEGLSGGRELAKALRADAKQRGVRIAVSAEAEPIVRYYKRRYRQANWEAIEKAGDGAYDYYVLTARDAAMVDRRGLHVVYRDAGLVLAK